MCARGGRFGTPQGFKVNSRGQRPRKLKDTPNTAPNPSADGFNTGQVIRPLQGREGIVHFATSSRGFHPRLFTLFPFGERGLAQTLPCRSARRRRDLHNKRNSHHDRRPEGFGPVPRWPSFPRKRESSVDPRFRGGDDIHAACAYPSADGRSLRCVRRGEGSEPRRGSR